MQSQIKKKTTGDEARIQDLKQQGWQGIGWVISVLAGFCLPACAGGGRNNM